MEIKHFLTPALLAIFGTFAILYHSGNTQQQVEQDEVRVLQNTVMDNIKRDMEQFSFPVVVNEAVILNSMDVGDNDVVFNFIISQSSSEISTQEIDSVINEVFYEQEQCRDVHPDAVKVNFQFRFHDLNHNNNVVIIKPFSFMCGRSISVI